MFVDWKNQYSENEYTIQSNLQIQRNAYQATNNIFHKTRRNISQFVWKHKKPLIAKAIFRKKSRTGRINLPDFRLYYKATFIRTVHTGTKTEIQVNETNNREINPHTYGHLILDNGGKNLQWRKDNLFNKWCWENWSTTCKRMKLEHFLTPYYKNKFKMD